MRHLKFRQLFGLAGTVALLSIVFFSAYGATINCNGQFICVGTESNDTMIDSEDTAELQGLGGDDTFNINQGFTPADTDNNNNDEGTKDVFGGTGDDTFRVSASDNNNNGQLSLVNVYGEDGDDTFRIDGGDQNNNEGLDGLFNGGRGDDTILIDGPLGGGQNNNDQGGSTIIKDGPGRDTIFQDRGGDQQNNNGSRFSVQLAADNEPDTVRLDLRGDEQNANDSLGSVTIVLARNSGRDVIQCRNLNIDQEEQTNNDESTRQGTVLLNGNRKATDPFGNNLFRAARLGGTAQTGCQTIVP